MAVDPDNRLLWRANWQRMDAETLRDSLLFVAGNLDLKAGGPPAALDDKNKRRTVYGFVSRRKLDSMLALFDFPNPNNTSEQRVVTNVPLQRLFMMNSSFVEDAGRRRWPKRLERRRTTNACGRRTGPLYGRAAVGARNCSSAWHFVKKSNWNEYARVLLNSNEFEWVN